MKLTKEETEGKIITILENFVEDWDLDEDINQETKLNEDLCFTSVNMIHFMANIDMEFQKKFPFEQLIMKDGAFKNELEVDQLVDYIYQNQ